ncbi:MAG: TonB family protein [Desulfobacterales bacterium]|nr:TonB family protein [Desulfobacterales bacterium]
MKRLLLSACMALALHGLIFLAEPGWLNERFSFEPEPRVVALSLVKYQPKRPETKPEVKPVHMPLKKSSPAPAKPAPIPKPKPREAVQPALDFLPDVEEDIVEEEISQTTRRMPTWPGAEFTQEAGPIYRENPRPRYPESARRRGYQGTVVLEVLVDDAGKVETLRLFKSSGHNILDKAALSAVEKWRFEPGIRGSDKVKMWVRVPIRFHLE